jgi:YVTN family beta-propeller protein
MKIKFLSFLCLWIVVPINAINSYRIVTTVNVGNSPAGIAVTPDNRFAYIANNNNDFLPGASTVSVLDLTTNTVIKTITHGSFDQPYTITINPIGTRAYVTNSNGTTVTIIDIASNTVIGTIEGFDGPSGMVITPDGKTAYVNNYGGPDGVGSGNGTTISVVNLITNTIVGSSIVVNRAPAALAMTPDGAFVYVANYVDGNSFTGTVQIIQVGSNKVVGRIVGFSGPFSIAITPNGKFAYVTNFGSNNFTPVGRTVSVIDIFTNSVIATIPVGTQASGLAITPNGKTAYVSNYNTLYLGPEFTLLTPGQGTINVIDIATNTVLFPVIITGASPANIAISPDGKRAYVSNYSDDTVSVVDIFDKVLLNKNSLTA